MFIIVSKNQEPIVSENYTVKRGLNPWHSEAFPEELKCSINEYPRKEGWFIEDRCGNQVGFFPYGSIQYSSQETFLSRNSRCGKPIGEEMNKRKIETNNENISIYVLDNPGAGGACHEYKITPITGKNTVNIHFQNGPDVNGIQQEDLLLVVVDRLQSFQKGNFACKENEQALIKCQEALMWLNSRTKDRKARNVEGRNKI